MQAAGRIGPNAILQLLAVLEARGQSALAADMLTMAGVARPPADASMLPQTDCAATHQALRRLVPDQADAILRAAGLATGDYILAHRIPRAAQGVLRVMPRRLAARVLAQAIAKHAWTFAGTGHFAVAGYRPLVFTIAANPLAAHAADHLQCVWHAAVFQRLYSRLVWPGVQVRETRCCACGDAACQFDLIPPQN